MTMDAFTTVTAVAVPFDFVNVDTDRIIPARFLHKPRGPEYAGLLFHDVRFDEDGHERADFILNQPAFRSARILVANDNFGCGSSREHAVWSLAAYGIRVVIAPSFGDIFATNCLKIGLVTIVLPPGELRLLIDSVAGGGHAEVDLERQLIVDPARREIPFAFDPFQRECLLNGLDDIARSLAHEDALADYEASHPPRVDTTALSI